MTSDVIIDDILRREGGYVDHPADRGGPTNFGITLETLRDWRGRAVAAQDVQRLTADEARAIYRARYITQPGFDQLPPGDLQALLVDCAVHHGVARARLFVRTLQKLGGLTADGVIGPQTLGAIATVGSDRVRRELLKLRGHFIAGILRRNKTQWPFAAGWLNRLMEFV
jgi:lysozyme family protein